MVIDVEFVMIMERDVGKERVYYGYRRGVRNDHVLWKQSRARGGFAMVITWSWPAVLCSGVRPDVWRASTAVAVSGCDRRPPLYQVSRRHRTTPSTTAPLRRHLRAPHHHQRRAGTSGEPAPMSTSSTRPVPPRNRDRDATLCTAAPRGAARLHPCTPRDGACTPAHCPAPLAPAGHRPPPPLQST